MSWIPIFVSEEEKLKNKTRHPPASQIIQQQPQPFLCANKHFHNLTWKKPIVVVHELFSHLKSLSSSLQNICFSSVWFLSLSWAKSELNNKLLLSCLLGNLSDVGVSRKVWVLWAILVHTGVCFISRQFTPLLSRLANSWLRLHTWRLTAPKGSS